MNLPSGFASRFELALPAWVRPFLSAWDGPLDSPTSRMRLAVALCPSWIEMEEVEEALAGRLLEARPRFMEALLAYQRDRGTIIYPDANGTLRITFGTVRGSMPADGMRYLPFTTLEGILEKDTGEAPFDTPPELLQAMRAGDYRDHGDFEAHLAQARFDGAARGIGLFEVLGIDAVDGLKISDVGQIDGRFDGIVQSGSRFFGDCFQVFENHVGLVFNAAFGNFSGGWINGKLPGRKKQVA